MRATALFIFVLVSSRTVLQADDGIQWLRDVDSAKRAAAQTNRPILLHFWSPNCPPCVKLDQDVYSRPDVKRALEAMFVPVRLNADEYPATAEIYGVNRWPTDVILAPNGQFVARLQCPAAPVQYLAQLDCVARGGQSIAMAATSGSNNTQQDPTRPGAGGALAANSVQQASAPGLAAAVAPAMAFSAPGPRAGAATDLVANYDWRNAEYSQSRGHDMKGSAYATDPRAAQPAQQFAQQSVQQSGTAMSQSASQPANTNSAPPQYGYSLAGPQNQPSSATAAPPAQLAAPGSLYGAVEQPQQQRFAPSPPAEQAQQQLAVQRFEMVLAAEAPPVGLDGYCPVQLSRVRQYNRDDPRYRFTKGDPRYGVVHRGRTYLFSGPAEQQEFLSDPDRYSPVMSGNDPVLAFDYGQHVAGQRKFGRYYGERVYLFASEETLLKFMGEIEDSRARSRPNRYTEAIYQAENPGRGMFR